MTQKQDKHLTITNSSRCCFLDCPYKYYCEYILGLSPVTEPIYFQWGSLVHDWAEGVDNGLTRDELLLAMYDKAEASKSMSIKAMERFEAMAPVIPLVFEAHEACWGEKDKDWEQLNVESKFKLELENGWLFKGKIDGVRRHTPTGCICHWERKTAAKTGPTYWERLPLDSQPKGYILALQRCDGFDVLNSVYDIFKKPALIRKQNESWSEYYTRVAAKYLDPKDGPAYMERGPLIGCITPIEFTQQDIDNYYYELLDVCEMIEHSMYNGLWPKHHPGNRIGGCIYAPLCLQGEDSDARHQFRRREDFHPEL